MDRAFATTIEDWDEQGLCRDAGVDPEGSRRTALRGRHGEKARVAVARSAAAQRGLVSRSQSDRRHHGGVRPGSGCPRRRHPGQERNLHLGWRREGLPADRAGWHVAPCLEHRCAGALSQTGDLRHGKVCDGRRVRAGHGLRHPAGHQGYVAGASGGDARPNSRQRRQPAGGAHGGPDAGSRHDDAGAANPGTGSPCMGPGDAGGRGFFGARPA